MKFFVASFSFLIIIIGGLWILFFNILYPIKYKNEILTAAHIYNVDPVLIAAVINAESSFDNTKVSPKNAIGLMQLLPSTASSLTKDDIDLFDPETNINLGVRYLSYLIKKFDDVETALFAYNAGEGNVSRWLASEGKTELRTCPFQETNAYVSKIKNSMKFYKYRI